MDVGLFGGGGGLGGRESGVRGEAAFEKGSKASPVLCMMLFKTLRKILI